MEDSQNFVKKEETMEQGENVEKDKEKEVNEESIEIKKNNTEKKKIKHLVIPGGGPTGYIAFGILKHLEENKFWNINDIESIYGTSIGTVIGLLLAMKFEWNMIVDYIIKRPWQEALKINPGMFFDAYSKKGLFGRNLFEIFFKPFFIIKDWSMDITMKEVYEATNIELHFFTLEVNLFEVFDINYKNFPDLPVLTAIQMSAAIPGVVCPVCLEDRFYMDGGVICNYPLKNLLPNVEDHDTIFGINNFYSKSDVNILKEESNILEYMVNFISSIVFSLSQYYMPDNNSIKNELIIPVNTMSFEDLKNIVSQESKRQSLYDLGVDYAIQFLESKRNIELENSI
jgi:predicted acylesterase/phospholipase RssA